MKETTQQQRERQSRADESARREWKTDVEDGRGRRTWKTDVEDGRGRRADDEGGSARTLEDETFWERANFGMKYQYRFFQGEEPPVNLWKKMLKKKKNAKKKTLKKKKRLRKKRLRKKKLLRKKKTLTKKKNA
jgi:hypothetical protein